MKKRPEKGEEDSELPAPQEKREMLGQILSNVSNGPRLYPCSFAQQRLWFLDRLEPGTPLYNIPVALRLEGDLNADVLELSLNEIIQRHASLRTTFTEVHGQPVQIVWPKSTVEWAFIDSSDVRGQEVEARAHDTLSKNFHRPFDLERGPLVRGLLIKLRPREHWLVLTMHHIVSDGWSVVVFLQELADLYGAHMNGKRADLKELPIQYADFAVWQRGKDFGELIREQMSYWMEKLGADIPVLELPTDHVRPPVRSYHGVVHHFSIHERIATELRALCRREGVTMFMSLVAAFKVFLYRYTAQEDIVVGTPIAGRTHTETEALIGLFVNTLALRTDCSGNPTFIEFLSRIRDTSLGAYSHQEVPLEKIVEDLRDPRTLSRTPLFQVMFALQEADHAIPQLVPLQVSELPVDLEVSKFDLTLSVRQTESGLTGTFEGSGDLFEEPTIARMGQNFACLVEGIVANPEVRLSELPLVVQEERKQLVVGWNAVGKEYSGDRRVHELVDDHAKRTPEAVAVVCGQEQLTYGELEGRSNELACYLQQRGVGPGVMVGLYMERSLHVVTGLMGILKAGGVYVPLDPAYPAERLRFMVKDAGIGVVVTEDVLAKTIPAEVVVVVNLNTEWEQIRQAAGGKCPAPAVTAEQLAYVIYTSGTTGQPKGVMITHGAIVRHCLECVDTYGVTPDDVVLQFASWTFDASLAQILVPLISGSRVVMRGVEVWDARELRQHILEDGITVMHLPTAYWKQIIAGWAAVNETFAGHRLRLATVGGEAMRVEDVRLWHETGLRHVRLLNAYGPTETTITATSWEVPGWDEKAKIERVLIGSPRGMRRVYILDRNLQPVPVGVAGELCIGGPLVARGYLNRPELTAEKFVSDPYSDDPGGRLYRTGDLARYRPDGTIEFLGRMDDQVKIRGYRIELGEIETTLGQHPGVQQAVVVLRGRGDEEVRLVAYCAMRKGWDVSTKDLRKHLKRTLPEYMVPANIVIVEQIPLTTNGKVDSRNLPDVARAGLEDVSEKQIAQTPEEEVIAGIWSTLLKVDDVGMEENFFELGGHSLLAMQVMSRIRDAFKVDLPLKTLFERPTIRELATSVRGRPAKQHMEKPILPAKKGELIPLSFAQQRLWFLDQLKPGLPRYNLPLCFRLRGKLDREVLERAITGITTRHEILRTSFHVVGGQPFQKVEPTRPVALVAVEIDGVDESARMGRAMALISEEARRSFDLGAGHLLRASLFNLDESEHFLVLVFHHIVFDGWSMDVLIRELRALYEAGISGGHPSLPDLHLQYTDYALWQRTMQDEEELAKQLVFWKEQLSGELQSLNLPLDHPRPAVSKYRGACERLEMGQSILQALKTLARQEDVTLFMILLSAFKSLLYRYTHQDEIIVGCPIAGRARVETEELIGFFANTIVLKTSLEGEPTFRELLHRVRIAALGAYTNQDLPFERVVEELHPKRERGRTPFFDVMFALQQGGSAQSEMAGIKLEMLDVETGSSKFDLLLSLKETPAGIIGTFEYDSDLFERETIRGMARHLIAILDAVTANPALRISEVPLLTETDQQLVLGEWNQTRTEYPREWTVDMVFEDQAQKTPDAIALVSGSGHISYKELNERADSLARILLAKGVGPEKAVGLLVERSSEAVVAMLAVMKAGGFYVPLESSLPTERMRHILSEAGARLVLTQTTLRDSLPEMDIATVCLDHAPDFPSLPDESGPRKQTTPQNLAYVMFTSGSTGAPKGVCVPHRGVVRLVKGNTYASLTPGDVFLLLAPLAFDASTFEIWGSLLNGARLVIAPPEIPTLSELGRCISVNGITTLWLTSGLFHQMVDFALESFAGVRQLLVGGDVVSPVHAMRFLERYPECRLINGYGPTEGTTFSSCHQITLEDRESIPIGRPISNTQVYILDANLRPVPVGIAGEICIGGDGLARGYLNSPDLAAEKFVRNPFSSRQGERLYRSGDLGRWTRDGVIQFLGRRDSQLKVRGYRVELKEVESALIRHADLLEAFVQESRDDHREKRIVAYCVCRPNRTVTRDQLRGHLQRILPEYMIPAHFVFVDMLPLTDHGKIDRKRLPSPDFSAQDRENVYVPATDTLELQLVKVWESLLGGRVGIRDNFFDLGGHSLLAVRLFAELERSTGRRLPLSTLFEAPTIEELAMILRREGSQPNWSSLVPIKPSGARVPIYFVHGVGGNVLNFYDLARYLHADQPVYGLQSVGLDGNQPPLIRVEDMAARYIEEIQKLQPHGPYLLGGMSFGGMVAFEIAHQLVARGEVVALLALLDTMVLTHSPMDLTSFWKRTTLLGRRARYHMTRLLTLPPREKIDHIRRSSKTLKRKIRSRYWQMTFDQEHPVTGSLSDAQRNVKESNFLAARRYGAHRYTGNVTLFVATDRPIDELSDPAEQWSLLAHGGVCAIKVPGDHATIMSEPNVRVLAQNLDQILARVNSEHSSVLGAM
jgi:amino acid adenylation domain-containing protein